MRLRVPYYEQSTDVTCGPATMRMILAYFGTEESEATLARELRTNTTIGTRHSRLVDAFSRRGLHTYVREAATLEEVAAFLSECTPVIVHYRETEADEGHYAVVVDMNDTEIYLNDPWHGEAFALARSEFEHRWMSGPEGMCERWFVAVSNVPRTAEMPTPSSEPSLSTSIT